MKLEHLAHQQPQIPAHHYVEAVIALILYYEAVMHEVPECIINPASTTTVGLVIDPSCTVLTYSK